MSFHNRLLLASLTTLAVGLGALLVFGNVMLDRRVDAEVSSLLRERATARVARLALTADGGREGETPHDAGLDRDAWIYGAGGRLIEGPTNTNAALKTTPRPPGRASPPGARPRATSPRAPPSRGAVPTPRAPPPPSMASRRMPASSARSCSSFSRISSGEGGRATNRSSALRRQA